MPSAGDQPGWAPDPERPGMLRWWNGLGWSDARKAPDGATERAMTAAREAVQSSTLTPQQVARVTATRSTTQVVPGAAGAAAGTARRMNPFAPAAATIGVLALIIGVWGVLPLISLVVSLAGLVRSRRLALDGHRRTGLGQSVVGLVTSALGLMIWLPQIAQLPDDLVRILNS